jgi:hypothetical protein
MQSYTNTHEFMDDSTQAHCLAKKFNSPQNKVLKQCFNYGQQKWGVTDLPPLKKISSRDLVAKREVVRETLVGDNPHVPKWLRLRCGYSIAPYTF